MTKALNDQQDAILSLLEDELHASADEDILESPRAAALAAKVRSIVDGQLRTRSQRLPLPARVPPRRDRRGARLAGPAIKREIVDRVLVASSKARALVANEEIAAMNEAEL